MNLLIGTDPEVFIKKAGRYFSAHAMVPGSKENPHPVEHGAVQVDGMALEFNTDPVADAESFVFNVRAVMAQLQEMVPDYELAADPVARFDPEYMQSQPEEALLLGCEPDSNAWSGEENTKPDCSLPIRTGAGHVHVGWRPDGGSVHDEMHVSMCRSVVQQLDFYLGLPSLIFDADKERRSMYGAAGAFRIKPYGVEYRVLSNAWLRDDKLIRWVFNNTAKAMQDIRQNFLPDTYGDIQSIINNSDVDAARAIIRAAGIPTPEDV